ncbi:hypothetical protein N7532_001102 [Penicillium argentinense]|uniref:Uncharacterized protein n=1 Tax=Penicillium argentinense TaxID=1131581 RepID=A0A9W9KM68_9EURO|nr:uncharacterized protein N7532_001102 [Penicillium argentinense]KAJ5110567.1 hypothetical protein N7532_001102 [Penicillium argentinense]
MADPSSPPGPLFPSLTTETNIKQFSPVECLHQLSITELTWTMKWMYKHIIEMNEANHIDKEALGRLTMHTASMGLQEYFSTFWGLPGLFIQLPEPIGLHSYGLYRRLFPVPSLRPVPYTRLPRWCKISRYECRKWGKMFDVLAHMLTQEELDAPIVEPCGGF